MLRILTFLKEDGCGLDILGPGRDNIRGCGNVGIGVVILEEVCPYVRGL